MKKAKVASHELLVNQRRVTLLELLDRLLDKGVVAKGEIILSVADIDLVYLNLGLLLSSVKTVEKARGIGGGSSGGEDFFKEENPNIKWVEEVKTPRGWQADPEPAEGEAMPVPSAVEGTPPMVKEAVKPSNGELANLPAGPLRPSFSEASKAGIGPRANIDPNNVEKGLVKLVLTLIELLRKLMEKQAIRRMEAGFLTASEVERMGIAFQRLEEKMKDLKQGFSLKDEDLNLDLGPLGELM